MGGNRIIFYIQKWPDDIFLRLPKQGIERSLGLPGKPPCCGHLAFGIWNSSLSERQSGSSSAWPKGEPWVNSSLPFYACDPWAPPKLQILAGHQQSNKFLNAIPLFLPSFSVSCPFSLSHFHCTVWNSVHDKQSLLLCLPLLPWILTPPPAANWKQPLSSITLCPIESSQGNSFF